MLDVKLPFKLDASSYATFVAFGCVLFYLANLTHDIFCLDLLITNKWYTSDVQRGDFKFEWNSKIIKTRNNDIHLMQFDLEESNSYHVKFSLYDVIPKELVVVYRNYYQTLVSGYVTENIESKYNVSVPNELIDLIANLYPCFV